MRNLLLSFLFVSIFPSFASADLLLKFDRTLQVSAHDQPTREGGAVSEKASVYLGENYIRIRDGNTEIIYDFARRRAYQVYLQTRTFTETSLYANVDFRRMELSNRLILKRGLQKMEIKPEKVNFDTAMLEHHFSMVHPGSGVSILRQPADGGLRFRSGDKELAFVTDDGEPLTPSETKLFVQFVRYHLGGHPVFLESLSNRASVPRTMKVFQHDAFERKTYVYKLSGVEKRPTARYNLTGLRPDASPDEKVDFVKWLLPPVEPGKHLDSSRQLLVNAESSIAAGRSFEALLTILEHSLQTGDPNTEILGKHRALWQGNTDVAQAMRAISARDRHTGEEAVRVLQSLRERAGRRQHVLYVFEANHHYALGRPQEAARLFEQALRANPMLVGAYKDVGALYHASYRTDVAWMCWDRARRLAPKHPLLAPITAHEEKLVRDYPDFF